MNYILKLYLTSRFKNHNLNIVNKIKTHIRDVNDFPKKGIIFKDITPVLKSPSLCKEIVNELSKNLSPQITHIVGVESRGFLFGLPLSIKNNISFVLIRKKGKLPYKTVGVNYDLEYGSASIEMNLGDINHGDKVIIHDDLLATGGTALAAARLIVDQGGEVMGFSFLIELAFLKGREKLQKVSDNINSIVKY
jgi:adenine phosphoribosyltransferase